MQLSPVENQTSSPSLFENFANRLAEHPDSHARFINTLSMLEYMGARKILKSQIEQSMTLQVLAHAAEEIRHAQIFKKVALKMSQGELTSYSNEHLYCGPEARHYFQTLDQTNCEALKKATQENSVWSNYLLTTLLIEERANEVYPIYEMTLSKAGYPRILSGIVQEEVLHLKEMRSQVTHPYNGISPALLTELRKQEAKAFSEFMAALMRNLPEAPRELKTTAQG